MSRILCSLGGSLPPRLYRESLTVILLVLVAVAIAFITSYLFATSLSITGAIIGTTVISIMGWPSYRLIGLKAASSLLLMAVTFTLGIVEVLSNSFPNALVAREVLGVSKNVMHFLATSTDRGEGLTIWVVTISLATLLVLGWYRGYRAIIVFWLYLGLARLPLSAVLSNALLVAEDAPLKREWLSRAFDYIRWSSMEELLAFLIIGGIAQLSRHVYSRTRSRNQRV